MAEPLSTGDLNDHLWDEDSVQFARLIVELRTRGVFDDKRVMSLLCASMDLTVEEIWQLVRRAEAEIDRLRTSLS